jgi:alkylated DNA repair dioxygenase AlkB
MSQLGLFGRELPAIDEEFGALEHIELAHGAWLDVVRGWLRGHETVFETLRDTTAWRETEEHLYDRVVRTPRLVAVLPDDGPGVPVLAAMRSALERRYGESFPRTSLALYRDGRDSVAWHGDRVAREMDQAVVATVSVGTPRRFLLRPYGGGRSTAFELGFGDLLVMGGSCQRCYQHSIPKVARASSRIAIMFRPDWAEKYEA